MSWISACGVLLAYIYIAIYMEERASEIRYAVEDLALN